jgi:hypothetical protein
MDLISTNVPFSGLFNVFTMKKINMWVSLYLCVYFKLYFRTISAGICSPLPISSFSLLFFSSFLPSYSFCSTSAESLGTFLGNSTTGASPRQRWRHVTIGELGKRLFLRVPTRGRDATMEHVTPRHADNRRTVVGDVLCGLSSGEPVVGLGQFRVESSPWAGVEL